ncbi:acetyl-CoA synthetase-like protein [Armillaria gallica]|uniref:Acetyl-CoA synthetase-like protein n=1 Tax=Armillaria gallica TaxID=47427 RepID=A0A2H3DQT9_ARMGA|nr:acetyl-CoA synthetase-like protein [Armillaria gallica]
MSRAIPLLPQTQALTSKTFIPPPLDGSLTLPEIYDWHSKHNPSHRLFVYTQQDGTPRTIYWPEAVRAVHTGAKFFRDRLGWKPGANEKPVVAILAISDTITYWITLMSILKTGYVVFPISPRNSAEAVAHLLRKVSVRYVLVSKDPAMQAIMKGALDVLQLSADHNALPSSISFPSFEDLFAAVPSTDEVPYGRGKLEDVVMYIHSSGSTAFPKAIPFNNRRIIQLSLIPYFSDQDLTNKVFAIQGLPMFHLMGVLQMIMSVSSGFAVATFTPLSPPIIPTPDSIIQSARKTNSDYIYCVPVFAEAWARNDEYVTWLSGRGIIFGGGSLNKNTGDYLTAHSVSIDQVYGSTECGGVNILCPARNPNQSINDDWEYFRMPSYLEAHMVSYGNNTFELVIVSNDWNTMAICNAQVEGRDAYSTSDLLEPHPTKEGFWRIFGRVDDQIMHSTGEKTNASPLGMECVEDLCPTYVIHSDCEEGILNQDPHIAGSVMFGRGKFHAGVLIDPKPEFKIDPSDTKQLTHFRNQIWPTIEKMNKFAPKHSRIFKEMILVSSPSKPFTYTTKNTARRLPVIEDYEDEIQALYDTAEDNILPDIPPPCEWNATSVAGFIRAVVRHILKQPLSDEDDLFEYGCDSLQATWIQNTLLQAICATANLRQDTDASFVYKYPTIGQLNQYIQSLTLGTSIGVGISPLKSMESMVDKYTADFPGRRADTMPTPGPQSIVVLLTGSTGGLGSYLLAELIKDPSVSRIYAINRPSGGVDGLWQKQRRAFIERGIDTALLKSSKIDLLEGDLSSPQLGLPKSSYRDMLRSVTHIIHNAWRVDFKVSLRSFESNIKGLKALVDLSLSSVMRDPPRFIFISSIGVLQNPESDGPVLERCVGGQMAVGNGYSESKWVAEKILETAGYKAGFISTIPVSWVPLDMAAQAIRDICCSHSYDITHPTRVLHLAHPKPTPWSSIALALSNALSVPLVPYDLWVSNLERCSTVPAYKLLEFFQTLVTSHRPNVEAFALPMLDSSFALSISSTLSNPGLQSLGSTDALRWLSYWNKNVD